MNKLHTEKLLRHFYIFASLCVITQISFGQESYPKHCTSLCLEYSKSYSAQNSEPYNDYCAVNWGQIKNLPVDSRKLDASAFARNVASGSGTLRDKALQCLYSAVESGNAPNGSRVGVANSANLNVDNRSTDQSQQNQSTQQQSQQAHQQAQQAQEAARVAQTRADQARQGRRKTHDPAAEAHECVAIDNASSGNFGAFKNTCGFRVNFYTCNYRPRITQGGFNWSADFDCDKQQMGMHTPGGGVSVAAHNRNTETVHWFACKAPATPVDVSFVQGQGLSGRCN